MVFPIWDTTLFDISVDLAPTTKTNAKGLTVTEIEANTNDGHLGMGSFIGNGLSDGEILVQATMHLDEWDSLRSGPNKLNFEVRDERMTIEVSPEHGPGAFLSGHINAGDVPLRKGTLTWD